MKILFALVTLIVFICCLLLLFFLLHNSLYAATIPLILTMFVFGYFVYTDYFIIFNKNK